MTSPYLRIRQLVIGTSSMAACEKALCETFGMPVTDRVDPMAKSHAEFGIGATMLAAGSQFIELVQPMSPDTPVGRHLKRLGGDGGYMIILQIPDREAARKRVEALGIRIIWEGGRGVYALHLHPKDVGGTLLSLGMATPAGTWDQGGPDWEKRVDTRTVRAIRAAVVACEEPEKTAKLWGDILGVAPENRGPTTIDLFDCTLRFEKSPDGKFYGPAGIDLEATDPQMRGKQMKLCGINFRLV